MRGDSLVKLWFHTDADQQYEGQVIAHLHLHPELYLVSTSTGYRIVSVEEMRHWRFFETEQALHQVMDHYGVRRYWEMRREAEQNG
jgi:hypothetical protein